MIVNDGGIRQPQPQVKGRAFPGSIRGSQETRRYWDPVATLHTDVATNGIVMAAKKDFQRTGASLSAAGWVCEQKGTRVTKGWFQGCENEAASNRSTARHGEDALSEDTQPALQGACICHAGLYVLSPMRDYLRRPWGRLSVSITPEKRPVTIFS